MNALTKFKTACCNGYDIPEKLIYLAYIQLHMENLGLHPDGYSDLESGYTGWHVSLMDMAIGNPKQIIPEDLHYPLAFLRIFNTLDLFKTFHENDIDNTQQFQILALEEFFKYMETKHLVYAAETAMKLYLFHATEDNDVEHVEDLRIIADILLWISKR